MAKSKKKDTTEIESIKNSLITNEYILKNHPNLKEKIDKENEELNLRLSEIESEEPKGL